MKFLCVQCMKLNDLADDLPAGEDGKIRFPCPHCGFVTVITRKTAKNRAPVTTPSADPPTARIPSDPRIDAGGAGARAGSGGSSRSLDEELFDGSEKEVGDWMVRRLDGTEAGPLTFEQLKEMIRDGDIGKIDEVRQLEERYVPAAFHELTADLFNELDMAGVAPTRKG